EESDPIRNLVPKKWRPPILPGGVLWKGSNLKKQIPATLFFFLDRCNFVLWFTESQPLLLYNFRNFISKYGTYTLRP
ncbi:unnamed protein product, partial [Ixodes pacificus]